MLTVLIASCIGGLFAVFIVIYYIKSKNKTVEDPIKNTSSEAKDDPVDMAELSMGNAIESLLNVNIYIRTHQIPQDILTLVESMIDDLQAATPRMIERHPDHDLTYELKQICEKHILNQLKEFFDMSKENQGKYMDNLKERLNEISDLIKRARETVETDEVTEMKMIAGFLESKYSKPLGD